ncbi:MAG TPA: hypothetical protein VG943_15770 [Caulobacterales bacterium]|nr:hypothetical protein [Caulobacterales bacterium]
MPPSTFAQMRARAYELADTGRFDGWLEIASMLESEGFDKASLRLRSDPILLRMIDARCEQAKDRS